MKYTFEKVVGGFGRDLKKGEEIPVTLARTYTEQSMLRSILKMICPADNPFKVGVDLGCGFGRMTPVLGEFCKTVFGIERDEELVSTAARLWPSFNFQKVECLSEGWPSIGFPQLLMTFTVLQHLSEAEFALTACAIQKVMKADSFLVLCEETDPRISGPGVTGRTEETYKKFFPGYKMIFSVPRYLEPENGFTKGGGYMVFKKFID